MVILTVLSTHLASPDMTRNRSSAVMWHYATMMVRPDADIKHNLATEP